MTEVADQYLGAEVLFPRGDQMVRGCIVACMHNDNGNIMGRAHSNPLLDNRVYQVKFPRAEVAALIANIIVESIYTQCNTDGNEYLLFDILIDHWKEKKAISISHQKISVRYRPVIRKLIASWQICFMWKDGSISEEIIQLERILSSSRV